MKLKYCFYWIIFFTNLAWSQPDIKVNSINILTNNKISQLSNLGQVWGFLKYYHPAVYSGEYDWDSKLLQVFPQVLNAKNNNDAYEIIERWVDSLGTVPACTNCSFIPVKDIKLKADYGTLFDKNNLAVSLMRKLRFIAENYNAPDSQYYVAADKEYGELFIKNESAYENARINAPMNFLALYRFWNYIQYFYPYRHLIGKSWTRVLNEFIPVFYGIKNDTDYVIACTKMITSINDSHGCISLLPPRFGSAPLAIQHHKAIPVQTSFIENKCVVTGYYQDSLEIKNILHRGDIIDSINGISIDSVIQRYSPYIPASNYPTKLRELIAPMFNVLRGDEDSMTLYITRNKQSFNLCLPLLTDSQITKAAYYTKDVVHKPVCSVISNNIGYLCPQDMQLKDTAAIERMFANTKGLIIDLRYYPTPWIVYLMYWLEAEIKPIAIYTTPTLQKPGTIVYKGNFEMDRRSTDFYKKRVVIIVNEWTQSRQEFAAMIFRTAKNAVVLGSKTAGADGTVCSMPLPYGLNLQFTKYGIENPDSTETQRKGIKIDIPVQPTIKGVLAGKDELLDKAIDIIENKKYSAE
ncbi:hypothetical protein A9P82_12790 [Arachidicoccus ginsenosidimutans]|nr:hypothetical protein A9P82_12790 [Arachidicoccus sp. BS20]